MWDGQWFSQVVVVCQHIVWSIGDHLLVKVGVELLQGARVPDDVPHAALLDEGVELLCAFLVPKTICIAPRTG